jgi:hypothetical protein
MPTPAIVACTFSGDSSATDHAERTRGEESVRAISGFAVWRRAPNGRRSPACPRREKSG